MYSYAVRQPVLQPAPPRLPYRVQPLDVSVVQVTPKATATAALTLSVTFNATPTPGNTIIVKVFGLSVAVMTSHTVTDNQGGGNIYSEDIGVQDTLLNGEYARIYRASNVVSSGTFTVTFTFTGSAGIIELTAEEVNANLILDQSSSATGSSTSPAPGSVTTTAFNEYMAVVFAAKDASNPATVQFPARYNSANTELNGATLEVGGAGWARSIATETINPTFTIDASSAWAAVQATYKIVTSHNYTVTASDSPLTTDTFTRVLTISRTDSDSPSTTDSLATPQTLSRLDADSPQTADTPVRSGTFARSDGDSPGTSDSPVRSLVTTRSDNDSPLTADAVSRTDTLTRTDSDTPSTTDSIVTARTLSRSDADSPLTADTVARSETLSRSGTDAPSTSDSDSRLLVIVRISTDSPGTADTVFRSLIVSRTTVDSSVTADAVSKMTSIGRTGSDLPGTADLLSRQVTLSRIMLDSPVTSDVTARSEILIRTTTDLPLTSDSASETKFLVRQSSDTPSTSDAPSRFLVLGRTATDLPSTVDSIFVIVHSASRTPITLFIRQGYDMPLKGTPLTITYMAWNTTTQKGQTGDAANHTLRCVGDGTEFTPANASIEIDPVERPGEYKLSLLSSETNYNLVSVGGVSSTGTNILIVPQSYLFTVDPLANATAGHSAGTGYAALDKINATQTAIVATWSNPVLQGPKGPLYVGDSYKVADGNAITQPYPSSTLNLTGAAISLVVLPTVNGVVTPITFTGGTVTNPGGSTQAVQIELTATQTSTVPVGIWPVRFVATLADGDIRTLAENLVPWR